MHTFYYIIREEVKRKYRKIQKKYKKKYWKVQKKYRKKVFMDTEQAPTELGPSIPDADMESLWLKLFHREIEEIHS